MFAAQAILSAIENTLTHRRSSGVDMPFVNHGGMWGDLFLMAPVNGLIGPYIAHSHAFAGISAVLIGAMVSVGMHVSWARMFREHKICGHIFDPFMCRGHWYREITFSGWAHLVYMMVQVAFLVLYVVRPMPSNVVRVVSCLLIAHVTLGILQPGWYCERHGGMKWNGWRDLLTVVVLIAAITVVAVVKVKSEF